jgi:hypothetical protein
MASVGAKMPSAASSWRMKMIKVVTKPKKNEKFMASSFAQWKKGKFDDCLQWAKDLLDSDKREEFVSIDEILGYDESGRSSKMNVCEVTRWKGRHHVEWLCLGHKPYGE